MTDFVSLSLSLSSIDADEWLAAPVPPRWWVLPTIVVLVSETGLCRTLLLALSQLIFFFFFYTWIHAFQVVYAKFWLHHPNVKSRLIRAGQSSIFSGAEAWSLHISCDTADLQPHSIYFRFQPTLHSEVLLYPAGVEEMLCFPLIRSQVPDSFSCGCLPATVSYLCHHLFDSVMVKCTIPAVLARLLALQRGEGRHVTVGPVTSDMDLLI